MVKNKQKFYVVWKGRKPGIYYSWSEALIQIDKFLGAKYKSFLTEDEATKAFNDKPENHINPKNKKDALEKVYLDAKIEADIHIYCDGGCEPNPGECGSGVVVYTNSQLTHLYYGLYKELGTNNIAELTSFLWALKVAKDFTKDNLKIQILCDSQYAIDSITKWAYKWIQNNGKKAKGEEVKNFELIKEAHELYNLIKDKVTISHIKGHAGFEGNELADRMTLLSIKEKQSTFKLYKHDLNAKDILLKISR